MEFTLTVKMDNAVFRDSRELPQILHKQARKMEGKVAYSPGDNGNVLDSNGNTVGSWSFKEKRDE